jgi:hypothetical protein
MIYPLQTLQVQLMLRSRPANPRFTSSSTSLKLEPVLVAVLVVLVAMLVVLAVLSVLAALVVQDSPVLDQAEVKQGCLQPNTDHLTKMTNRPLVNLDCHIDIFVMLCLLCYSNLFELVFNFIA